VGESKTQLRTPFDTKHQYYYYYYYYYYYLHTGVWCQMAHDSLGCQLTTHFNLEYLRNPTSHERNKDITRHLRVLPTI